MKKSKLVDILIRVISAEVVGAVSALLSGGFSNFFEVYNEPPLLPPKWLFPVVWVLLYALMGYSAYLISSSPVSAEQKKAPIGIYIAQLAVNFLWSIVFFRFEEIWAAFAVIVLLLVLIIIMLREFRKISPTAADINIPYLVWVAFATYLNLATALVN